MKTCEGSNYIVSDHFANVGKMVNVGSKTTRQIEDYKLSRYACYLIAQNGDSRKKVMLLLKLILLYKQEKEIKKIN